MPRGSARVYAVRPSDPTAYGWKRWGGARLSPARDVVRWRVSHDALGRPLNGAHPYLLRFDRGQEPPARGFWSLAMYGALAHHAVTRVTIDDRDGLAVDQDGGLEIYIQHQSPGAAATSNWLPSPHGEFALELSIYWPALSVIDRGWRPPPIRRGWRGGP